VFKKKYLLLELEPFEAEFYHLPNFVPYFEKDQKRLEKDGFNWEASVEAMKALVEEDYSDEYKPYKSFIRKWDYYKKLTENINNKSWHDAQKNANQILSIDLLDPSVYFNLGIIARNQGEIVKSEQAYKKGLELVENKTPFFAGLAKTYEEVSNFDDAMYYWFEVFELSYGNEEHQNVQILMDIFYEAIESLLRLKVFDKTMVNQDPGSFIELSKFSGSAKALYEQELPSFIPHDLLEEVNSSAEFVPGENFQRMMRRSFTCNYNNLKKLNKLGVKLVHHKYTDLAVKVFERVYELSHFSESNKKVAT
jgi:tetratricopeptide (TPR) repeat protein